ncbi:MAG: flagellin [Dehalococcoidia bacterium]|nr:flagellin [Dehalococcoidia bacterium]
MSLQINTNVMAINAQRNLAVTNKEMGNLFEKLSSGLRVNRAADDAAGLAISEKMRAQIRGMKQGLRNAQDGVSMIQTAEGAMSETHAILQRMRELTVQAGSTHLSASDRLAIGEELVTLRSELDNIATRTRFNGLSLLTGALSVVAGGTLNGLATLDTGVTVTTTVEGRDVNPADTFTVAGAGSDVTITNTTTNVSQTITAQNMTGTTLGETQLLDFDALGLRLHMDVTTAGAGPFTAAAYATDVNAETLTLTGDGNATFRVGPDAGDNVVVGFTDIQSSALGSGGATNLDGLIVDNTALSSVAKSDVLLASIDAAIDQVSNQRAKLGAAQNQMESAINSLGVSVENLSASESRIRDADIAEVSSRLVSRQIMQQAGVAVLSQANTAPQAVLQLLQG